ncbi:hypothetical protein [Maribacter arenosus]|uniref:Uncharacterized protein n=1 Tax=Maribacter arenosus TaxID=1854708 RepID=A0ABR7VCF1_9FLAO|nr:hypothetical protein [Maribacter arenosus]MBD0849943.1 hypothetical protein [Maribacter arenosus]
MKDNHYNISILVPLFLLIFLSACKNTKKENNKSSNLESKNYVEVVSSGMNFEMDNEINSGWTTFKYSNKSSETHFFILEKLPDSVGIERYQKEFLAPFKRAYEYFIDGEIETGNKQFEDLPAWSSKMEICGGVALTSPNRESETTLFLEPGTYIMECYVRMPNGMPHVFYGMLKEFKVSATSNGNKEPTADEEISISSANGIAFKDSLVEGDYTFSVDFKDQKIYEHMLGHDINLVKLENEAQLDSLNSWVNLSDYSAFKTPVPKGLTFLGGVEDLFGDKKGYFNVTLTRGQYVLISEVPNAIERKMFKLFEVTSN